MVLRKSRRALGERSEQGFPPVGWDILSREGPAGPERLIRGQGAEPSASSQQSPAGVACSSVSIILEIISVCQHCHSVI